MYFIPIMMIQWRVMALLKLVTREQSIRKGLLFLAFVTEEDFRAANVPPDFHHQRRPDDPDYFDQHYNDGNASGRDGKCIETTLRYLIHAELHSSIIYNYPSLFLILFRFCGHAQLC